MTRREAAMMMTPTSGGGERDNGGPALKKKGKGKAKAMAEDGGAAGAKADSAAAKIQTAAARVVHKNIMCYREMPAQLLAKLCTVRGIKRMSRITSRGTLATKLEQHDLTLSRSSPFLDDVRELANRGAEGSCSVRSGQANKPNVDPGAVTALRSYLTMAEPAPNSIFKFENEVYKQADLLKIIEEEDAGECGAGRSGDSRSSGGGSAAGRGGVE
ncbi:unnamed protein product [Ectocarpus sp. CCAP 1310/34]|nr:unnamed protein product [Ectocarpus sp. CCAP 1310/34]